MSDSHPTDPPLPFEEAERPKALADRLWSRYERLREDGVPGWMFLETLSHLLLLKRADRLAAPRPGHPADPELATAAGAWHSLRAAPDGDLPEVYQRILKDLGSRPDTALGRAFADARGAVADPLLLRELIDDLEEGLTPGPGSEVEGDVLEALFELAVQDARRSSPHHTPRFLVDTLVRLAGPGPADSIADPACGSGGFLAAALRHIREQHPDTMPSPSAGHRLEGNEPSPASRLAGANLLLQDTGRYGGPVHVTETDPLDTRRFTQADIVLSNPPFGMLDIPPERPDFAVRTRDKALNHLQHIMSVLAPGGRAAVILPDGVLFGSGPAEAVRRLLLHDFDLHTLIRLPTGIFHGAPGVRTNVLYFTKPRARSDTPATTHLWVYDLRTGHSFHPTRRPLRAEDLTGALEALRPGDRASRTETPDGRFKRFTYENLINRDDANLDLTCPIAQPTPPDDSPPEVIAAEISQNLRAALAEFEAITHTLAQAPSPSLFSDSAEAADPASGG
ncbi:SAM-dependent DNA methyltransferase [Kitasatospora xanthocidica]|uniref:HsdM family class I SAM-dependent methyltransferase n=1 Tax=Kitasatospora xanthocidica TaxID=83382 RepID=UPI0016789BFE|nr:N-6 DNA methylase [Kitasatospora xanthocidica]GHF77179.1 SAM-dependent DNA methyltransferase [Kitasatospora xanthocidica]